MQQMPTDGGGVGGWGREWEAVGWEAYHEVGPHGEPLAVVDLLHTQLGGHVIIGGLISDAPAHVHHLPDTGDTQVTMYRVSQNYPNMYFSTIISTALKPLKMWIPKFYEILIKRQR